MATQQEILDKSYDILLAKESDQIHEIFSSFIIGVAENEGLTTFEEITTLTGISEEKSGLNYSNSPLMGLSRLTNLTTLKVRYAQLSGDIDVTGTNIKSLYLDGNSGITSIVGSGTLNDIEIFSIDNCSLINTVNMDNGVNLKVVSATGCTALTSIGGSIIARANIEKLELQNSAIASVTLINQYLVDMAEAATYQSANGGVVLTTVAIQGGTNAAPTATGLAAISTLQGYGVTVTYNS